MAEIKVLRCRPADIDALVDAAMDLLPMQPAIVGAMGDGYERDDDNVCFYVVVEAATPAVARAQAGHGLREALLGAGIGLEHASQWAPLQLELAPQALDLQPLEAG